MVTTELGKETGDAVGAGAGGEGLDDDASFSNDLDFYVDKVFLTRFFNYVINFKDMISIADTKVLLFFH